MDDPDSEGEDFEEDGSPDIIGETDDLRNDGVSEPADLITQTTEVLPDHLRTEQLGFSDEVDERRQSAITEQVKRMEIISEPVDSGPGTPLDDLAQFSSRPRSTTKSSATSEEEVILFGGRTAGSKTIARQSKPSGPNVTVRDVASKSTSTVRDEPCTVLNQKPAFTIADSLFGRFPVAASSTENVMPVQPAFAGSKPSSGRRRGGRGSREPTQREIEEEALIQDYIENMKDEESDENEVATNKNEHFRFFDGNGEEDVKVQTQSRGKEKLPNNIDDELGWSSGDLEDFDDLSTTDEEVVEISEVFSHRVRPSGPQYLVTAVGADLSEARWVLHEKLVSSTAITQIEIFEEVRTNKAIADSNDSSTDSEAEEALNDLMDALESADDENDRLMQRTAKMSDAQIARALALQEELGMDSQEVLLFNGQEEVDDDNEFANSADFIPFSSKRDISTRTRSKQNRRKKDSFPSAGAFADVLEQDPYGGFDIMDFDRPSLKPKRKGRKSAGLPFELEDDDLAFQLQQSWANDREKKASKKREREEMRQAGLLGSKASNGRIDLFAKYQNSGMDAEQIKTEVRSFLVQEFETLALAPMAADMRASVHRLAKALGLKSHSQGKGDGRFTVLTKATSTPFYTLDTIWEIDALMAKRKFFPMNAGSYKSVKKLHSGPKTRRTGGGGVMAGASYMDGEVVGASAPEIGVENRGRAMLEKMGWSSGMGIGALGNQGRTEVIKHVVKNTKAGLG